MEEESTRDKIVSATLEIMKTEGLENLTLRSLGARLHMHHTAIYRYFATKDDLLSAVFVRLAASILYEAADTTIEPRARLRQLCFGLRGMFHTYPSLAPAVVLTAGTLPQAQSFQLQIVGMLRELGVAESNVARCYQALETHVIGGSYYDFTSAPDHLSQRRARYRSANDASLDEKSRRDSDIDALNEATFIWVLDLILDGAVAN